jgi:hypothetical protein
MRLRSGHSEEMERLQSHQVYTLSRFTLHVEERETTLTIDFDSCGSANLRLLFSGKLKL